MIGLMDCNNFFVSCERLFRPDLAKKPVLVLSSNDGCVVSRSQEVKDLGIPMGIPFFKVKEECLSKEVAVFSSNFTLYRDISKRVMEVLAEEVGLTEQYSIDEAFFVLESDNAEQLATKIRLKILKCTGIPVSIGVADTKTIAKAASVFAKKTTGVAVINAEKWKLMRSDIPCESIWGIGRGMATKLLKDRVNTVKDFLLVSPDYIHKNFGVVGERLRFELEGVSVHPVNEGSKTERKSVTSTRSFGNETRRKETLRSALTHHVEQVALKLREQGLLAAKVGIVIRPSRFGLYPLLKGTAEVDLATPTAETSTLLREVLTLLDQEYKTDIPYKKAGVIVSKTTPFLLNTDSLFQSLPEKGSELSQMIDRINIKHGRSSVRYGSGLSSSHWWAKADLMSKPCTTDWSQICCVKAK